MGSAPCEAPRSGRAAHTGQHGPPEPRGPRRPGEEPTGAGPSPAQHPNGPAYSPSVSSTMVNGPSLTSSTCMFAANVPVATWGTSARTSPTKCS